MDPRLGKPLAAGWSLRFRREDSNPYCPDQTRVSCQLDDIGSRWSAGRGSNPRQPLCRRTPSLSGTGTMERVTGIEPASPDWKSGALAIELHPHGVCSSSLESGSNRRPAAYKAAALPTELPRRACTTLLSYSDRRCARRRATCSACCDCHGSGSHRSRSTTAGSTQTRSRRATAAMSAA